MSSTIQEELEETLSDMGLNDVNIQGNELNYTSKEEIPSSDISFGTIERDVFNPLPPTSKRSYDESISVELDSGIQVRLNISARPVCGNCNKMPTEEHEERGTRKCAECSTTLCSCAAYCHTCQKPLCYDCRTGYSDEGFVLCEEHKQERYNERQFEAEFQVWAKKLDQKLEALDRELEFRRAEFDKEKEKARIKSEKLVRLAEIRQKRDANKVELKKKRLEENRKRMANRLESELERRKTRLERFKTEVQAEIDHRKQDIEEYRAVTEREDKRSQRRLDEKEIDNEFQVNMREQEIKEMETKLDARMEILEWVKDNKELEHDMEMDEAELAMEKRKKMVEIADSMRQMKWDEANDFLDIQGRLQNDGFERLNQPNNRDNDDDEEIIIEKEDDDRRTLGGSDDFPL